MYVASLGGDVDLVPFALVLVNVLMVFVLAWFGAELARLLGRHAAWGFLFPLYPGFVYSLGFDLTEIVTSACLVGTLVCLRRRFTVAAVLLATYAVFTRRPRRCSPLRSSLRGAGRACGDGRRPRTTADSSSWVWCPSPRRQFFSSRCVSSGGSSRSWTRATRTWWRRCRDS